MGKALQAYRRYRELADRGEFSQVGEVLDENWIENCLGLTGWTLGLDIALANLQAGFGQAFSGLQVTEHEVARTATPWSSAARTAPCTPAGSSASSPPAGW